MHRRPVTPGSAARPNTRPRLTWLRSTKRTPATFRPSKRTPDAGHRDPEAGIGFVSQNAPFPEFRCQPPGLHPSTETRNFEESGTA